MNSRDTYIEDEAAIAIVGMACHLPGALNITEYWANLQNGVESVQFYTDEELLAAGESAENLAHPNYVRAQPYLKNYNRFDASFWGFNPQDAAVTDPAHRLFLEVAYQALEHAGHTGYDNEGRVAVFASSGENLYRLKNLQSNPQLIDDMGEFLVRHTGNCMNFLATRLSYELDLRGPSINVQTACSSTLVGVHMAVQSLLGGECDTAIVGGSTVVIPQQRGYIYREGEILSPDGHCRPFDAHSQGTVFGSGAGAIVVKRYADAIADGDTVYGVVRGTAINNDGAQKIGYLAPGVDGQAAAVAEALSISGVNAAEVSYIEAHGTGTPVGDPIEFEALNQVYREASDKRDYCHVGSVKSNIGHLGEAAGIASIIKVILSLQHKKIPPTINYQSPNSDIALDDSPFLINNQLIDWSDEQPRIAGITALGAGGTNAHIIVSEPMPLAASAPSQHSHQLLVLSAKTPTALNAAARHLAQALEGQPLNSQDLESQSLNLADVAYTLQLGRRNYPFRRAIAVDNKDQAIALLKGSDAKRVVDGVAENRAPSLVFMFPGGGAQYAGMGADLYHAESIYREAFDDCLRCLDVSLAEKIRALVFANNDGLEEASVLLERPSSALPALFATEYALAKQLIAWGAEPTAFIGHSMGEYTAACLAGVLTVNDAMRLVALRGELFEQVPEGGMLSVALAETDVRKHLSDTLDIAAVNAADLCVVSGPIKALERLQSDLEKQEIDCTRIRINVAAHSAMLESILETFRSFCQSITFSKPTIPFTSNVSGGWISDAQAMDANYWVEHLRSTVRFSENIVTVLADDTRVLVEVGPGRTLTTLSQAGEVKAQASFNTMRHPKEQFSDVEYALRTYGQLWAAGVAVSWATLWGDERRQRIALPGYAFERKTYWVDAGVNTQASPSISHGKIEKRPNMDEWFSCISWMQSPLQQLSTANITENIVENIVENEAESKTATWLVFTDSCGLSNHIVNQLTDSAHIITVQRGKVFKQHNSNTFSLSDNNLADVEQLFEQLSNTQQLPQQIVYLWPVTDSSSEEVLGQAQKRLNDRSNSRLNNYETNMQSYFWGLFNLSKVLCEYETPIRLTVVSSDMQSIATPSAPEKSLLIGPLTVLPHEMPHIATQSIDISLLHLNNDGLKKIAKQIVDEISTANDERMVAYRGSDRWIRTIKDAPINASTISAMPINEDSDIAPEWLRPLGSYLITGGLGGIGLTLAQHLAQLGAGQLILLGRHSLPERSTWTHWLERHAENDTTSQRIRKVQAIERCGA
ncbi:MAG: beta-ketoacyl synthase N-terminal-like domain-containing protein, partial [Pseudomonadales bacterium]|nr:beta-ketoacyl synthase N-terminal-like domain-containing protein [Pseudomonadales bacterium]